jgi:steryl-sulfatase
LGIHCGIFDLYCHHPLRQGFDYFYGAPLSNVRDFGDPKKGLTNVALPYFNIQMLSIGFVGFITTIILFKKNITGKCLTLLLAVLLILLPLYVAFVFSNRGFKLINSIMMRNYESVEQPINFVNITQNLVNEGVQFLNEKKETGKPFLLVMSWLQVHTVLHASKRFQGHSRHGDYGDNVEEMDWSVGEIMKALKRLGFLDNTLVVFTSDNGGHLEERLEGRPQGGWNGIFRGIAL